MKKYQIQNTRYKILFMGTPEFGASILQQLIINGYQISAVITAPDKPAGRKQILTPPPVKKLSLKYKIPVFQPEKVSSFKFQVLRYRPDLIVVAAYGQIIPQSILEIPKYGCLNIHPSLLPKYRGASPVQFAILNGEKYTGATIMLMDEKMDHGPILAQEKIALKSKETNQNLHQKLARLGADLLLKTIPQYLQGKIRPKPQNENKATYTKILSREDGKINWQKSAEEIERQIRAFSPWPGAFLELRIKNPRRPPAGRRAKDEQEELRRLKIIKARIIHGPKPKRNYGEIFTGAKKEMLVQTGRGCLILEKVQLEGKKPISGEEFLRGRKRELRIQNYESGGNP